MLLKLETRTTQHEEGFTSGNMEQTVSVLSDPLQNMIEVTQDYTNDLLAVQEVRWLGMSIIDSVYSIPYMVPA
jgi:hypothetical protein